MAENRQKEKDLEQWNQRFAKLQMEGMFANPIKVGSLNFFSMTFNAANVDALRAMADEVKEKAPNGVAALSCLNGEKAVLIVCCGKNALSAGMHAGKIVKEALTVSGGSGGGKPDMAMGGTANKLKIDESIAAIPGIMEKMLK